MTLYACAQCGCTDIYREYRIRIDANRHVLTVYKHTTLVTCRQCKCEAMPIETDTPKPYQHERQETKSTDRRRGMEIPDDWPSNGAYPALLKEQAE